MINDKLIPTKYKEGLEDIENLKGNILFDGNTASDLTLSDDITNYNFIEVYGYTTAKQNTGKKTYTKIFSPALNDVFELSGLDIDTSGGVLYVKNAFFKFDSVTSIKFQTNAQWYMQVNGAAEGVESGAYMRITKVIGYK